MKNTELTTKDFENFNFKYYVEYEYDTVRNCSDRCDPYCRCSTLTNLKVTSAPNIITVVETLFKLKIKSEILAYCLDRLFRINKMDDPNSFSVWAENGYYGEEVGGVDFNYKNELLKKIEKLLNTPDEKKIEFILLEEYGEILPKMKGLEYKIKTVSVDDIKLPNREYLVKINKEKVEAYKTQLTVDYPMCVCIKDEQYYTLLDGYHRLTALKQLEHTETKIFSGE